MSFERRLFYYFENLKRQLRTQPLILGGVSISGGGAGSPPGGFVGLLPQSRVTFDYLEDNTTNEIPVSGASLLDNLNRIRYDLANISGGGSADFLGLTDVDPSSYSGMEGYSVVVNAGEDGLEFALVSGGGGSASTFLDLTDAPDDYTGYAGQSVVVNVGEDGLEFTTISGGSGGFSYIQENLTSQIPAGGDDYDLQYTPVSGTLILHNNGITQEFDNYTVLTSGVHTKWSPISGDELLAEYFYGSTEAGVTNPTITVISGATSITGVNTLNIQGMAVTDDGSGQVTISGGTGSGSGSSADFTFWHPDAPPASPSAYDDEFADAAGAGTPSGWTLYDVPTSLTITESEYGLTMVGDTTADVQGIYQAVPAGSEWSIITKVAWLNEQSDDCKAGLLLLSDVSDLPNSDAFYHAHYRGSAGGGIQAEYFLDYNSHSTTDLNITNDKWVTSYYLRLRAYGTTWALDWSTDGLGWYAKSTLTRKFTPEGFGICLRGNTTDALPVFSFFRYDTNIDDDVVVYGDRIDGFRST